MFASAFERGLILEITIGGRTIRPEDFGEELKNAAAKEIAEELQARISSVRHPVTGEFPVVVAVADSLEDLHIRAEGSSMTVTLDSGKTAELAPEKTRRIDYGYAVDGSQAILADRIISTGDGHSRKGLQGSSPKAELSLYLGSAAASVEAVSTNNQATPPAMTQQEPPSQRHDYVIGL